MTNSRQKGARGEREWAQWLNDHGYTARRGVQFAGGPDSPDVVGGIPGTHCEVKRVEALRILEAIDQASRDAGDDDIPYVAWRKNRRGWVVIIEADHLLDFAKRVTT